MFQKSLVFVLVDKR